MLALPANTSEAGWGSGSFGSLGSSGSTGSSGSYGSSGSSGSRALRAERREARRAARAARHASSGSSGSYGSSGSTGYSSSGSRGSSGSYVAPSYGSHGSSGSSTSRLYSGSRSAKPSNSSVGRNFYAAKKPPVSRATTPVQQYARIKVDVPADATVQLLGKPTTLTGTQRSYRLTKLPAGKTFACPITVEVVRNGETLTVEHTAKIAAGMATTVDFVEQGGKLVVKTDSADPLMASAR